LSNYTARKFKEARLGLQEEGKLCSVYKCYVLKTFGWEVFSFHFLSFPFLPFFLFCNSKRKPEEGKIKRPGI